MALSGRSGSAFAKVLKAPKKVKEKTTKKVVTKKKYRWYCRKNSSIEHSQEKRTHRIRRLVCQQVRLKKSVGFGENHSMRTVLTSKEALSRLCGQMERDTTDRHIEIFFHFSLDRRIAVPVAKSKSTMDLFPF